MNISIPNQISIAMLEHLALKGKITVESTADEVAAALSAMVLPGIETAWKGTPSLWRTVDRSVGGIHVRVRYPRTPTIPHETNAAYVERVVDQMHTMYSCVVPFAEKKAEYAARIESMIELVRREIGEEK